jgi:hypothetical protein
MATTPDTYWTDLRFKRTAASLDDAGDAADDLIDQAERLGWTFELGHTTAEQPRNGLANRADKPAE